jgi:alginate O-acetyltransferase complex protein AlgI
MNFHSETYIAFFLIVFLVYWRLQPRGQKVLLVLVSYCFYARWDWRFAGLIALSTLVDYFVGLRIFREVSPKNKRLWLVASIVANVGILALFKYFNFFAESFVALAQSVGLSMTWSVVHIALPVGISFWTFRSLTYTVDIYRGRMKPTESLLSYATFLSFFPLLGAGPIVRARDFLPQLESERLFDAGNLEIGFRRFLLGFFKKAFIADTLSVYVVNPVFANPGSHATHILWLAMFAFAVQIYCDFSGYSSMAIGSSRLLGFKIPENFVFPYLARDISDFWRRWHITLMSWFKEYFWWGLVQNISYAGEWRSKVRWFFCLFLVFLVSGLWHGAGWTFVVWGAMHGICSVIFQMTQQGKSRTPSPHTAGNLLRIVLVWLMTQMVVCLLWVVFRSNDLASAVEFLNGLFLARAGTILDLPPVVWIAFGAFLVDHLCGWIIRSRPHLKGEIPSFVRGLGYCMIIIFLFHAMPESESRFIYFQF